MSTNPTNGELALMIKGFRELVEEKFSSNEKDHKENNNHLKTLNGQVAKNSKFRIKALAYLGILGVALPIILTVIINKYL